ncbi:MAG TPA: polysaccharide deacetylase family protein [Candidatus Saccharimonadales bacterium]|nr:polysaccharide deacetylase family protein [Candidatus Saccharimonadales bacterium]
MNRVSPHIWAILAVLAISSVFVSYIAATKQSAFKFGVTTLVSPNPTTKFSVFAKHSVELPIITYHYVEVVKDKRDTIRKSLSILPSELSYQIRTLLSQGYEPVYVKEIPNIVNGSITPAKKPIALTFDDGYEDFYTDVFPIIKEQNVKVTAFIIADFIGKPNYMTHEQLEEVIKSGLVEIGAHTLHHPKLSAISAQEAKVEIAESKLVLEKTFNIKVETFAYPYGVYNDQIAQMVRKAGYTAAVSEVYGTDQSTTNMFFLSRARAGAFDALFVQKAAVIPAILKSSK